MTNAGSFFNFIILLVLPIAMLVGVLVCVIEGMIYKRKKNRGGVE